MTSLLAAYDGEAWIDWSWVGDHGDSISLERFGASAPGTEVLEKLGFNLDNVVARATALLERVA